MAIHRVIERKGSDVPRHSAVSLCRASFMRSMLTLNESLIELATNCVCSICQHINTKLQSGSYCHAMTTILGFQFDIGMCHLEFLVDDRYFFIVQIVTLVLNSCMLSTTLTRFALATFSFYPAVGWHRCGGRKIWIRFLALPCMRKHFLCFWCSPCIIQGFDTILRADNTLRI